MAVSSLDRQAQLPADLRELLRLLDLEAARTPERHFEIEDDGGRASEGELSRRGFCQESRSGPAEQISKAARRNLQCCGENAIQALNIGGLAAHALGEAVTSDTRGKT